jgi:hypothetical protein
VTFARRRADRRTTLAAQPALHLVLLYALAFGRRWWELDRRPLWLDELTTIGYAQLDGAAFVRMLSIDPNMTLYYLVMFVWVRLVGVGADEALLRFPSVLVSSAVAPAVYLLGRRLHSPSLGLAAGGLLAIHGYHAILSRETRGYGLFSLLAVVGIILLVQAVRSGRRRDWLLLGLVNGLSFYCHIFTVFVVIAQAGFVLLRRSRAALGGLLLSGGVAATLATPLLPWALRGSTGQLLKSKATPTLRDLVQLIPSYTGSPDLLLPVLYLVLMLIGLAPWIWRRSGSALTFNRQLLLSWLLIPPLLVFAISQVRVIFSIRYLFPILPAVTLLAGLGLVRLPRPLALGVGALLTVLALNVPWSSFPSVQHENWRDAARQTASSARPDDGWIFGAKWAQQAFEYYAGWHWGRNPNAPYANIVEPFDWAQIDSYAGYRGPPKLGSFKGFAASHPRIWLIDFRAPHPRVNVDPVLGWLKRKSYAMTSEHVFPGGSIRLFTRSTPP